MTTNSLLTCVPPLILQTLPMAYFGIFFAGLVSSYVFISYVEQYC